ncbi:hypothetical protein JXQ70_08335 [bacterium]|nr:hypothetical protein [bacterium]
MIRIRIVPFLASFMLVLFAAVSGSTAVQPYLHKGNAADYWTEMNEGISAWNIAGIAIDHKYPDTIYIFTLSDGMFKSEDGGLSWIEKNAGLPVKKSAGRGSLPRGKMLAMDPIDSSILYLMINGEVYRTTNGADNWVNISDNINICAAIGYQLEAVLIDPQHTNHLFAAHTASGCNGGIYESTDYGDNWSRISTSGDISNDAWVLALDPSDPQRMYCSPAYLGFLYSLNGGRYWTLSRPSGTYGYGLTTGVHPTATNRLFLGLPEGFFRSESYGQSGSWIDLTASISGDIYQILFSPSDASVGYLVGEEGLYRSADSGLSWTRIGDYTSLSFRTIDIHPTDPNTIYIGSIGSGVYKSTDGGTTLTACNEGLPNSITVYVVAIAPSNPQIYYAAVYQKGFYRSEDKGEHWTLVSTDPGITGTYVIAVSHTDPDTVLAGFHKIYKSTDGGYSWEILLDTGYDEVIYDIQLDPTDNNIIFATSDRYTLGLPAALFRTLDGGSSWQLVRTINYSRVLQPVIIDPTYPDYVYVGICDTGSGGVLRSQNGGDVGSWSLFYGGLTGEARYVDGLTLNPFQPSEFFLAARDRFIYSSSDYAENWETYEYLGFDYGYLGKIVPDVVEPDRVYFTADRMWYSSDLEYHLLQMPMTGLPSRDLQLGRCLTQDPALPQRFVTGDTSLGILMFNKYEDYQIQTAFPEKVYLGDTLDLSGSIQSCEGIPLSSFAGTVTITIQERIAGEVSIIKHDTVQASGGLYTQTYLVDSSFGDYGRKELIIYATDQVVDASIMTEFSLDDLSNQHTVPSIVDAYLTGTDQIWASEIEVNAEWDDSDQDSARIMLCDTDQRAGLACLGRTYCESSYQAYDPDQSNRKIMCSYLAPDDTGTRDHTNYLFLCDEYECAAPVTLHYSLNYAPVANVDVPQINLVDYTDQAILDLDDWFTDEDGDVLSYTASDDPAHFVNASVTIVGNQATLSLTQGSSRATALFYADDSYATTPTASEVRTINFIPENHGVEINYDSEHNLIVTGFYYYDDNADPESISSIKSFYRNGEFLVSRNDVVQSTLLHFEGDAITTDGRAPVAVWNETEITYPTSKYDLGIHFGTEAWVTYETIYGQQTFLDINSATIELWIKRDDSWANVSEDTWIMTSGFSQSQTLDLLWESDNDYLTLVLENSSGSHCLTIDTTGFTVDDWHYIAVAWELDETTGDNFIRLYADEFYTEAVGDLSPFIVADPLLDDNVVSFGHTGYALDELRISNAPLAENILSYSQARDSAFLDREVLLDDTYFSIDDTISVQYCPSDGMATGTCLSDSVLISNPVLTTLMTTLLITFPVFL